MLSKTIKRKFAKVLREQTISSKVKDCEYAVRGQIPLEGIKISKKISEGDTSFPFKKVYAMNIGNPQAVGQGFINFNREVIAGLTYPPLLESNGVSADAKERVKYLQSKMSSPVGAYTANSFGHHYIRTKVAEYIMARDGPAVETVFDNIALTNGASECVRLAFKLLIRDQNDGIMVPIPQYPLYSALIALSGGSMLKYYLNEEKNWGVDAEEIIRCIKEAKDSGKKPRAIVVINPGNPTGNVLSRADIEDIINICYENKILIMADEVYQENIYESTPFISFRKVLAEMPDHLKDSVELLSMHSISKGFMGECGLRGGYLEMHNIGKFAYEMIYKLKSIELCSNIIGQLGIQMMVDPPKEGRESAECVEQYWNERNGITNGLLERAKIMTRYLNSMDHIHANAVEGAMYGFPSIDFSPNAIKAAKAQGVAPDFMYCMDMLNTAGIMTVPGSGFGQKEGSHHFRLTNLVCPTEEFNAVMEKLKTFNNHFHAKFE